MTESPFQVLLLGRRDAPWSTGRHGTFDVVTASSLDGAGLYDAVVWAVEGPQALSDLQASDELMRVAGETALVVLCNEDDAEAATALIGLGAQDVVVDREPDAVARAVRHAIERKRVEQAARTAYATDLATGLPHQAQLLEYMTQLLALRERDPSSMGLIVVRIEGPASTAARLGTESANVLRRKVAVRLRGALRASDVVAAIGPDTFGILLGRIEAPAHGERVAAKLARTLQQPFQVAGHQEAVAAAVGLALYPEHGRDARALLQRALAQAASIAAIGREGFATHAERGPARAANDPGPTRAT